MKLITHALAVLTSASLQAAPCQPVDLAPFQPQIGTRQLTFVAMDLRRPACWDTDAKEADARHRPWSTFKIPHFLIALETQAVASPDAPLAWDRLRRPAADHWPPGWRQDQSLNSAFERSAAWYFQELVPKIGRQNYGRWLGTFGYGNQDVPPGRDDFWLAGPLMISAREQARFLSCVATSGCGASPRSVAALEAVARADGWGDVRLVGKTGSGPVVPGQFDGAFEGWYVGYVRSRDATPIAAFALYVRAASHAQLRTFRLEMAVALLKHLRLWPQ